MRSPASTSGTSPPVPEDGYPQRGSVVGDAYRLDALVGEGPSGVVYNAWHLGEHRAYAVKVLHRDLSALTAALVRLRHDNQAIERLHHPHLGASAAHVGQETPLLCRPLLPGESLRCRLELGPLPLPDVARLFLVLCGALEAAGRHGVVHGDLKPENILLMEPPGRIGPPVPQVIDFGMCHLRDHEGGIGSHPLLGTIGYLAPEQIQGDGAALDGRADVFALGALLFECLTGRPAFEGATPAITVAKLCLGERPRPSEHAPGLPSALDELFLRACHRQPEGRLPSPRALWTALHAAVGEIDAVQDALREAASPSAASSTVSLLPERAPARAPGRSADRSDAPGASPDAEAADAGDPAEPDAGQAAAGFSPSTVSLWPRARSRVRRHSGAQAIQLFKELEHARQSELRGESASHDPDGVAELAGLGDLAARALPSSGSQHLRRSTAERAALLLDSGRFGVAAEEDEARAPRPVSDDEVTGRLHSSKTQPRAAADAARDPHDDLRPDADPTGLGALVARRARAQGQHPEPLPPVLGLPPRGDEPTIIAGAPGLDAPDAQAPPEVTGPAATEPRWLRPLPAIGGAVLLLLVLLLVLLS